MCCIIIFTYIIIYYLCRPSFFRTTIKENITEEGEGRKNKRKKQHYCTIVLLNMQNIPLVHYTKKSLAA